jgi:hypothetical protein
MTEQEISELLKMSAKELFEACRDFHTFLHTISLGINIGINIGQDRTHRSYNRMFRNQQEVSIKN